MVPPVVRQIWVISGVLLDFWGQGMMLAYTSCLLPALRAADSLIDLDLDTASSIVSSIGIAMTIGIFISSLAMDRLGRRLSHLLLALPSVAGWLLIYFATDATTLMVGRLANGLSCGTGFIIGCIAIGEYSSPKYRGLFLNLKTTALIAGSTMLHAISDHFHWRTVALISAVPVVAGICVNYTWPESPSWLVSKSKFDESEKVFFWLRGHGDEAVREFEALLRAQKARASAANTRKLPYSARTLKFVKKFIQKDFYKPVLIAVVSFIILEAVGKHYFPALAVDIMSDIFKDKSQSFFYTIIIDAMMLISCVLSCFLIKILKRRMLFFFCGIVSSVLLLIISLYLFLISRGTLSNDTKVLPVLLVLYFIVSNCGCTAIPLVLSGEIFPLPHRDSCSGIAGAATTVILTVFLKITPLLMVSIKVYGMFALFAVVIALSLLYLYFALPETKNRTLQEIEDYFNHGRFLEPSEVYGDGEVCNSTLLETVSRSETSIEREEREERG